MTKFFKYTRTKKEIKKDELGEVVYQLDETGQKIKDNPEYVETKFTDVFNLDLVIRVHMISKDHVVILLNDGHEESQNITTVKDKRKPPTGTNLIETRQRQFVQSEISIFGDDIPKLYEILDRY
jgi:hypothetical protein